MRRFLICAGLHGNATALEWLCHVARERKPDGLLFAGGVLGARRGYDIWDGTEWGMTHEDARFVEHFFHALGSLGSFVALIPGPFDTPLDQFLHLGMNAEVDHPGLHLAHATLITHKDVAVCGVGGPLVEQPVAELDCIPLVRIEYHLRPLWEARQPRKVLLLPTPPIDLLGGAEGSDLSSYLIDSYHPTLCVAAGPSTGRGSERIASTLVVNPGCLVDGCAAWLDWGRSPRDGQVELLRLREMAAAMAVGPGEGI
jgi:Icc-related predicted phosphoesterase